MSPRAASRLEGIGFEQVYDYVAGKADWPAGILVKVIASDTQLKLPVLSLRAPA